jgi:chemotaxis family two-component system response regulator Rcp1
MNDKTTRILLVEDNPGDVRLTEEALAEGKMRIELDVAQDGVEALEYLHRRGRYANAARADIVLLDLNLPRKNGREVLAEMKADPDAIDRGLLADDCSLAVFHAVTALHSWT